MPASKKIQLERDLVEFLDLQSPNKLNAILDIIISVAADEFQRGYIVGEECGYEAGKRDVIADMAVEAQFNRDRGDEPSTS